MGIVSSCLIDKDLQVEATSSTGSLKLNLQYFMDRDIELDPLSLFSPLLKITYKNCYTNSNR